MDKPQKLTCAQCSFIQQKTGTTACKTDPLKRPRHPDYCPSGDHEEIFVAATAAYTTSNEEARIARAAALVEGRSYCTDSATGLTVPRGTRLEDTLAFARQMGYLKIGIATCIGLIEETRLLSEILESQGFEPWSVCCKAGGLDKLTLGLKEEEKVRPGGFEAACNPIAQALLLNKAGTDMNVLVGLCVGHDMLFSRHSSAPVTTLVAKDRVTGHNPVAALYGKDSYFKRVNIPPKAPPETS